MRFLISLFLTAAILGAASIDTKLFEGNETQTYLNEIELQIDTAAAKGLRPKGIIQEERLYLAKVRSALSQVVQTEPSAIRSFETNTTLKVEHFYSVLKEIAELRLSLKNRRDLLEEIEPKLMFSKKHIENIVESEKSRLLSYQLHFAYYKLQIKNLEEKIEHLLAHEKEATQTLLGGLSRVECDHTDKWEARLHRNEEEIEKAVQYKTALQIELEKAEIEESVKAQAIEKRVLMADLEYKRLHSTKVMLMIKQSVCMLRETQSREFFRIIDEVEKMLSSTIPQEQNVFIEEIAVLRYMAKEVFGMTRIFAGATFHEIAVLLAQAKEAFSTQLFVYNEQPISFFSLFKLLGLIVFGLIIGNLYKRWIARISLRWPDMSQMSIRLASNIGYYFIIVITFIIGISSIGIDMTSISLIAGALSIGVGFGLQTVVSNLIAGIILMFERTIRIGDMIEVSDTLRGRVTDMRIRSTTIKTFDNVDIVIPNSSFIQNNVINWTLDDLSRRLHIPFGVAYGTDVKKVVDIILKELDESELVYIKDDANKEPEVWMIGMNSSSLDFELLVWVQWDNKYKPNSFRSDFLIFIYNALRKHDIEIPFAQLDLHVKSMPV